MREVNFLASLHHSTQRDYLARMTAEKPECMRIAKQYGRDYWDGDRKYGYGGYTYDGRWMPIAKKMAEHYNLTNKKLLDIGCGKGHLAGEFNKLQCNIQGCDISGYALANTNYHLDSCVALPWANEYFDFTYSINLLHNLNYRDLKSAIKEMVRVTNPDGNSYICVESYRTEEELMNLQCWALTCASFYAPDDWKEILLENGYQGDVEFITFP